MKGRDVSLSNPSTKQEQSKFPGVLGGIAIICVVVLVGIGLFLKAQGSSPATFNERVCAVDFYEHTNALQVRTSEGRTFSVAELTPWDESAVNPGVGAISLNAKDIRDRVQIGQVYKLETKNRYVKADSMPIDGITVLAPQPDAKPCSN